MLEALLSGLQQDLKIFIWAPIISAIFRFLFIKIYGPSYSWKDDKNKLVKTFTYGFWWGLDYHAYVLLLSFILVSLPGAFIPSYFAVGDMVRTVLLTIYMMVLYAAFMGKLIFYYHFNDTYNDLVRLGGNADKKNLLDIFFNENHGALILLGFIPFVALVGFVIYGTLATPVWTVPMISFVWQVVGTIISVLGVIALFYWLRYGGTFKHRNKPEWDFIPSIVKNDAFLAKAVIDDLIALELVYKHDVNEVLQHDDETALQNLKIIPGFESMDIRMNPLALLKRTASGARIAKPKHIFILVGESLSQSVVDDIYSEYHVADASKKFQQNKHTISINNFLPAGMISQPSITSLISGIYDSNLEINEKTQFWENSLITSLPRQMKQLGYKTKLWYGGNVSWASLGLFAPAMGFDECISGPDICDKNAPATWLGVYDHLFLDEIEKRINNDDEPTMHFIYTTSNHSPSTIPIEQYGWNADTILGNIPESVWNNKAKVASLGTYWYAEQALFKFVDTIKKKFKDSLIIVTGDHPCNIADSLLTYRDETIREHFCTYFAMYHKDIDSSWVNANSIGDHMQIMPTIFELIAPQGHEYYSLMPSIFVEQKQIVTPYHWMTNSEIGFYGSGTAQNLHWRDLGKQEIPIIETERYDFNDLKQAYVELTAWVVRHPEIMVSN